MTFLIVCVVASIIWGAILICKIVDVIHITDVNKLSECKIILVVSMSGLTLSWWLFFMDLMPSPGWMGWSFMAFCIRVERVVGSSSGCCQPMLMVKLPCGSASTSRTFLPSIASPMPRFSQVVVLPVPPFWLTMAIVVAFFEIFITSASLSRGWFGSGRKAAWWWVRYTEKRADIVSCFGSGCCSLQGT